MYILREPISIVFLCIFAPFKVLCSPQSAPFRAVPAASIAGSHDVGIDNTNWTSQQLTGITSRHCAKKGGNVLLGNGSRVFRWGLIWQSTEDWRCTAIFHLTISRSPWVIIWNSKLGTLSHNLEVLLPIQLTEFYSEFTAIFCLIPMRSVRVFQWVRARTLPHTSTYDCHGN